MPVLFVHQLVAKQDAMNGARRQRNATRAQQHLKLARAPVGIAQAQLDHTLFQLRRRLPGTMQWTPAAFGDRFDPAGAITLSQSRPVGREISNSRHKLLKDRSRRNDATTNRTRCSRTSIVFQGIDIPPPRSLSP